MPMNKEQFKNTQPIVYRTLSNALKKNRLAHAYLFSGPKGSPKKEVALLLAQSIACSHRDEDGFACQTCDSCQRIANEESIDFFWKHGIHYKKVIKDPFSNQSKTIVSSRIKKSDIVELQSFFEATSAEKDNTRVFILEDYDQATPEASNSLLKFLEEPQPGIYGILVADEVNNVLPTIQSRCQSIVFRPPSVHDLYVSLKDEMSDEKANMLAHSRYTYEEAVEIAADPQFEVIEQAAKNYRKHWQSWQSIVDMQTQIFVPKSPLCDKTWIRVWIQWLLFLIKQDTELSLSTRVDLELILVEAIDTLRMPVDLGLFLDRVYAQIRKVVQNERR